jgi:hypothetical protein
MKEPTHANNASSSPIVKHDLSYNEQEVEKKNEKRSSVGDIACVPSPPQSSSSASPKNSSLRRRHRHANTNVNSSANNESTLNNHKLKNPATVNSIQPKQEQQQEHHHHQHHQQQQSGPLLLLTCASGICICYLYFGMIQERLFSKNSNSVMKQCGNTTTFMLGLSCITNVIVAYIWNLTEKKLFYSRNETSSSILNQGNLNHKLFLKSKS